MRKWLLCVSALCLAGLLAACGEGETKDRLDWAIDPRATEEERKVLRAALAIVIAECPALADIDWEDVAKKRGDFSDPYGSSKPVRFYVANSENTPARPQQKILSWALQFSWIEPPGIATETWDNPVEDAREKNMQL